MNRQQRNVSTVVVALLSDLKTFNLLMLLADFVMFGGKFVVVCVGMFAGCKRNLEHLIFVVD